VVDPAGTAPGRGLYVCRDARCIEGFVRRAVTARGAARLRMGRAGPTVAAHLKAWWDHEAKLRGA